MEYKSIRIDELTIGDHYNLNIADECYFIMEYTVGAGYADSTYSLIHNFKKTLDKRGLPEWQYKALAIRKIARIFRLLYVPGIDLARTTLVPIPPSKRRGDPLFDSRMTQVLHMACPDADIKELITTKESLEASHNSEVRGERRPSLETIQGNLQINEDLANNIKPTIILFDDVITVGTHFVACKNLLTARFPDVKVIGMFVARRAIPAVNVDDYL